MEVHLNMKKLDEKTEAKIMEKGGTCYAVVVKAQRYYTSALGISEYKYLGNGRFRYVSGDAWGVWQTIAGVQSTNAQIADLKEKGYVVFSGRPSAKNYQLY